MAEPSLVVSFGEHAHAQIRQTRTLSWAALAGIFVRPPPEVADKSEPGWYCCAHFRDNYRHGDNFICRTALTLDYDHIDPFDELDIFAAYAPYAHLRYTTYSHTPDSPRWRIVLPLSRPVTADEFQAISRRVCDYAGIDLASAETNAAAQFMYLPSIKPGTRAEWKSYLNPGKWVDADEVLKSYKNFKDRAEWPRRTKDDHPHNIAEIVKPRDKPGIVGEFCRAFGIAGAIEKFELPYSPTSNPDRWTYNYGSRPEGAIIYDDEKLHSHHDTDPAHGQNNAFDLVRLHLFGGFDDVGDAERPITERPSYRAMASFAGGLDEVARDRVRVEFSDLGPLTEEEERVLAAQPPERIRVQFSAGRQLGTAVEPARSAVERCAEDIGVAVFGNRYVRPVLCSDRRGFDGGSVESVELVPYEPTGFAAATAVRIDFVRKGKAKEEGAKPQLIRVDCPIPVAKALIVSADKSEAIRIDRITMTPVIKDGTLHARRGHSRELGAWIVAPDLTIKDPNKNTAKAALKRVLDWIAEFPFDTELDRSAAVATLMTAAMRASIPHAPGTLVSKPDYGSGASTFCDLVHVVLTGRPAAVVNASAGRGEVDKAIDSIQLAGLPGIVIDNVVDGEAFNSIALAQVLTQPTRQIRVLGESRVVTVPCTQIALVNGNNIKIADDLVRRFIRVRLDPHMESPHTRLFKRPSLVQDAQCRRAELLTDLYTLALAHHASGEKVPAGTLAGFVDWTRSVVEPLVWLGLPDPLETQKGIAREDEKMAGLKNALALWHKTYGDAKMPLSHIFDDAVVADLDDDDPDKERNRMNLKQMLSGLCLQNLGRKLAAQKIDGLGVGAWLTGLIGRVVGGMKISAEIGETGKLWSVSRAL